jgi:hypothetical protein
MMRKIRWTRKITLLGGGHNMKFTELVGHSIIYDTGYYGYKKYMEIKVLKLSPSGKRVLIKYPSDYKEWEDINVDWIQYGGVQDSRIVEDLGEYKKRVK